ncbi:MAG: hypothetical protein ABIO24_12650 [Saprospiraceae bacterium]
MTWLCSRWGHDDLRVSVDLHIVPGRPVEQVIRIDRLPRAVRIGRGELPAQDKPPMGALAEVAFQSLEERSGVDARSERETIAADRVESAHVAKIHSLTNHGTGNLQLNVYLLFSTRMFVAPFEPSSRKSIRSSL